MRAKGRKEGKAGRRMVERERGREQRKGEREGVGRKQVP